MNISEFTGIIKNIFKWSLHAFTIITKFPYELPGLYLGYHEGCIKCNVHWVILVFKIFVKMSTKSKDERK